MTNRRGQWTKEPFERFGKEGRGRGKDYKPWLTIPDFPSQSRSSRIKGWKTNRVHHFLSDLEIRYFYLLEWADSVVDMREQFAIPSA